MVSRTSWGAVATQFHNQSAGSASFCLGWQRWTCSWIHGAIGMHVDDGLCGGASTFMKVLNQLEARFPFGSKRISDFTFTGIHVQQDEAYNIHLDQMSYVQNIGPTKIERHRRKQEQESVNEGERQGLRGLIGSLYAATNTRPDTAARLSLLQSKINCAKIADLLGANGLLGDAKKHSDSRITISSIPEEQIRIVAYSDASFATREKQQSQKGSLILAAHEDVFHQRVANSNPLSLSSKKTDRVVISVRGICPVSYCKRFELDPPGLGMGSKSVDTLAETWKVWKSAYPGIAVVDCKSLYDVITKNKTPQCQEHRTLIEALVIKNTLKTGIHPQWAHSAAQLADALTKHMDSYRLWEFLKHWRCCLHEVEEILKQRADRKAQKNWLSEAAIPKPSSVLHATWCK